MELQEIRDRINAIDSQMAELFRQRMEAVREVAAYKKERGLPVEDIVREQKLIQSNAGLIEDEDIRSFYIPFLQNTMDISKKWQHRLMGSLRIACDGEDAGSRNAAECIFPEGNIQSCESFEDVYRSVECGRNDVAVLPLENSDRGEVGKVYDLIYSGSLYVNSIYAVENGGTTTRYAVISRVQKEQTDPDSSEALLIMFTVRDEIGGLAKAINIISAYDFNMRVMRSRPMKDLPWHYYFYAELAGDCSQENAAKITRALGAACPVVRIAGRYTEKSIGAAGGPSL